MKEELISFETAKLAKEKGFNWRQETFYNEGSGWRLQSDPILRTGSDVFVEAPTQSLLQKWLREEHIIQIQIEWDTITYDGLVWHPDDNGDYKTTGHDFYEEALEQCLKYALTLIK